MPGRGESAAHCIDTVAGLEAVVGKRPLRSLLSTIDALDEHCARLVSLAPFAVAGVFGPGGVRALALGGSPGFARIETPNRLDLSRGGADMARGSAVALIFFVPGLGETLRVNGCIGADGGVEVAEAFAHCAKALIRSALWRGGAAAGPRVEERCASAPLADVAVRDFLARAPFAVIASSDGRGAADASPKGDPAGFLALVGEATIAVPDRPGNRRMDTFHNILAQPTAAILALIPGDGRALELVGRARLSHDPVLLRRMAVRGKVPRLAMLLDVDRASLAPCPAVAAADFWNPERIVPPRDLPRMARVISDHLKRNTQPGIVATAMRALVSEHVLGPALARDYKRNLY